MGRVSLCYSIPTSVLSTTLREHTTHVESQPHTTAFNTLR